MADFNQVPPDQPQSLIPLPTLSVVATATGQNLYDPDPFYIWPFVNPGNSALYAMPPMFNISPVAIPYGTTTTINDVYLAYLTFECPPCPPCPPVPTYPLSGQRWPWGFGG